jgi:predicted oxidoreductase
MERIIERIELAPGYEISRVIKGGWQLSDGHSTQISSDPVADMFAFVERGIDTFDCADIYTGVEDMIGDSILPTASGSSRCRYASTPSTCRTTMSWRR